MLQIFLWNMWYELNFKLYTKKAKNLKDQLYMHEPIFVFWNSYVLIETDYLKAPFIINN